MKFRFFTLVLCLVLSDSLLSASEAKQRFQESQWDLGVLGGAIFEGYQGDTINNTGALGIHAGYRIDPSITANIDLLFLPNVVHEDDENGQAIDTIGLVNYEYLDLESDYVPYIGIGIGYRDITNTVSHDSWNLYGSLGVKYILDNNSTLYLDARPRFNLERNEKGAYLILGVSRFFN